MSERQRSVWGWGWNDAFASPDERSKLARRTAPMLGLDGLEVHSPADPAQWKIGAPRVNVPAELSEIAASDRTTRAAHAYGKNYRDLVRGFRGHFERAPDVVAFPANDRDVERVMEWCGARGLALIPFGGGTSVVSGVEPDVDARFQGSVSLDLRRLDRVCEVDVVSRAARIQAGVMGPALETQLGAHGVTLRHFPQSFEFSTLGGWIATRAGGHYATLHTHIDDFVESLRMVTPTGVFETRRLPASGAGPSADRFVIGSEGAFGVITEAWMRVQVRPTHRATANVTFSDFVPAVDAVRALAQSGLHPSNCRLLDAAEAFIHRVSSTGDNVLLLAFESADHSVDAWMERALAICRTHGGDVREDMGGVSAGDAAARDGAAGQWRSAFLDAPYLFNSMVSLGVVVDTFETACTWDRFATFHASVTAAVRDAMQRVCGGGIVSCRFTHVYPDGVAPYYTFVAPGRAGDEIEQWWEIKRAASDAIIQYGGTITHHHAVGRLHQPWYERERPEAFGRALRAAKRELDPHGIMNPGVLIADVPADGAVAGAPPRSSS